MTRSVLAEAVIVGLLASVVGVGFGVVVAAGLRGLLGAFGMDLPHGALVIQAKSVIIPVILGVVITTLSSWAPARRASRVPPVAAIRGAEMLAPAGSMRRRLIAGGLVLALGLAALARGLFGGGGIALVGVGALIFYIAVAMLSPLVAGRLAQIIGAPAARFRGVPGRLGRQNAMRNPRRTASTAAALMIGLGLVSFVTILAASLKASFAATLERSVKADYIVQGEGQGQQNFSREVAGRLASQSQGTLSVVSPIRLQGEFHLDGALKHDDAVDPYTFTDVMDVDIREGRHDLVDFLPGTMLVSDKVAKDHGWKVGDGAALEFPRTGTQRMQIVAVYHDDALFTNGYIVTLDDFSKNATDDLDSLVLVKRAAGVSDNDARAAVDPIVKDYPTVSLKDQTQFKQDLANQINKLLGLVFVLLFLAVVIAFFGFAAVQAMGDIGVDRMAFPAGQLSVFVIFAALAGVVAAVFPARRAARLDVLAAIAHQ